ncbi:MAG TPA: M20/M25/M40 family metallo-hydrolase [Rhizomicrobium sp.]|nr:M20/M25/M40 family metallo-hydrolase [Rhizomicrobium sp.]
MAVWRTWLLALLAVAVWFLSVYAQTPPAPRGADAPATQFSALRAQRLLARLQGPAKPHPAGTPENAAVHDRLQRELAALGVKTTALSRMSCYYGARWSAIECARITDIIAQVAPGRGKAIVMMAHMDSVPAGPGAGDDGAGVAAIVETIRALKARGPLGRHPILALFTDGEEYGLLGAEAFVREASWCARIGVVINMEGRGSSGRSLLFQTSPGDGHLIDLYAHAVPRYASSSLFGEIYRFLPNDTDLTPMLRAGLPGYNFAFVGDVANYHTPNDTLANLDPRSLQSHGDNLLALMTALERTDFATLKGGDAAYLDVFGLWLPRLPAGWMLPLALAVFLVIVLSGWWQYARLTRLGPGLRAGVMPLLLLAGCVGAGFALHAIAAAISGSSDPSFAHPWALRLALAFGVWAVFLPVAGLEHFRVLGNHENALPLCLVAVPDGVGSASVPTPHTFPGTAFGTGAVACWLWLSGLGVIIAALLPGISPYFVFPSLIAAATLPFATSRPALLLLPALAALVVWLGLLVQGEELLGLVAHPLFTVPAAFALMALLPLLPRLKRRTVFIFATTSTVLAVILAIVAGILPPYSASHPQRLNLHYVEQGGRSWWAVDPVHRLPPRLRAAADFSAKPQLLPGIGTFFVAQAGNARFPAPSAEVRRDGDLVRLRLHGSAADGMMLEIPADAGLVSVAIGGREFALRPRGAFTIACATRECRDAQIVVGLKAAPTLTLVEQRFGLPFGGARLTAARGRAAVPSQFGDTSLLSAHLTIPAR